MAIAIGEAKIDLCSGKLSKKIIPLREYSLTILESYILYVVEERTLRFKNTAVNQPFSKSLKPSSPEEKCLSTSDEVQLISSDLN